MDYDHAKLTWDSEKYKLKYDKTIALVSNNNFTLTVKQLPYGFTILQNSFNSTDTSFHPDIYYANKKIILYNSDLTKTLDKSYCSRREWTKKLNLWKSVFSMTDNKLLYKKDKFSLCSFLDITTEALRNISIREEIYFPVAFLEGGKPVGGAHVDLFKIGSKSLETKQVDLPISVFHFGSCMFGGALYGRDQFFENHPLTEPDYVISSDRVINDIKCDDTIHPEEVLSRKTLENFVPFIHALSDKPIPLIRYHLPVSNYILYGLIRFLNGNMTKSALIKYIKIVKKRSKEHEDYLISFAKKHSLQIQFYCTLDSLGLRTLSEDTIIEELFERINFSKEYKQVNGNLKEVIPFLFLKIVDYLSKQDNDVGEVWSIISDKILGNSLTKFDLNNLFNLNYIDYAATLAVNVKHAKNENFCSLLQAHEKQVLLNYKNIYSDKFGEILCVNILPSFHVHMEECRNAVFCLKKGINEVNTLLFSGITYFAALQIAAIAINAVELYECASEQIFKILTSLEHHVDIKNAIYSNYM